MTLNRVRARQTMGQTCRIEVSRAGSAGTLAPGTKVRAHALHFGKPHAKALAKKQHGCVKFWFMAYIDGVVESCAHHDDEWTAQTYNIKYRCGG